jgi:hypothetical protein
VHVLCQLNGLEEWTAEEKSMPKIMSRPAEPLLKSQQSIGNSSGSQKKLPDDQSVQTSASASSCYMPSWVGGKKPS